MSANAFLHKDGRLAETIAEPDSEVDFTATRTSDP